MTLDTVTSLRQTAWELHRCTCRRWGASTPGLAPLSSWDGTLDRGQEACSEPCSPGSRKGEALRRRSFYASRALSRGEEMVPLLRQ